MFRFLQGRIRPGEGRLVLTLLALLGLNTLMLELADVVATAGFVSNVGTPQIIGLWLVDMVITVLTAGGFALVVDRVQRVKLIGWLLLSFGGVYLLLLGLFVSAAPDWLTYTALYIVADQQYVVFPLAFWALANDLYSVAQSKRLFALIATGAALGNLLGNGLAAGAALLLPQSDQASFQLLVLNIGLCLLGWVALKVAFRHREIRARQSLVTTNVRETLRVGREIIGNVPLFRQLSLVMVGGGVAFTMLEYRFIGVIDQISINDPVRLQTIYGSYKIALVVATIGFQWLITSRWLERVGIKSTFLMLPLTLLLGVASALIWPVVGGMAGRFLARLIQTAWDEPARKSVQGLVPDERRGRISVFLDSYCYALATIGGCLLLGGLVLLQTLQWVSADSMPWVYLSCGLLSAGLALWAAWRLRSVYDASLLNWRLARSRRRSVLDGIEF